MSGRILHDGPVEDLIATKILHPSTHFVLADPEFVGVMPIRQEIEVLPAKGPRRFSVGWKIKEIVGIGIVNPRYVRPPGYDSDEEVIP